MKKIFLLLTLTAFTQELFAQGVGINTTSPDPSAALDIQSTNKGILIPKVALQSLTDKTTIENPANSLMVYNTNNAVKYGIGYYYNAGTPSSPDWKIFSDIAMPYYYGIGVENSAIFRIENFNQTSGATAIYGWGYGNATGVYSKSSSGNALVADGKVKIFGNGQNPNQGKVLTTDDFGNATWQGGVAFSSVGVLGGGNAIVDNGVNFKIPFATEEFDLSNNFDNTNHVFIAPANGVYHFDSQIAWGGPSGTSIDGTLKLNRIRNGITSILRQNSFGSIGGGSNQLSSDVSLLEGDSVFVSFSHNTDENITLATQKEICFFNGRLVVSQ